MKYALRTNEKFEKSVERCIRRNYPIISLNESLRGLFLCFVGLLSFFMSIFAH